MDEHPGAGGGGGMAAAPRPQQPPPQAGGNMNLQSGGGCVGAGAGGGGQQQQPQGPAAPAGQEAAGPAELSRPQHYTIPGILHYIQHEWARFEMERAHWEVERAELQVQGARAGSAGSEARAGTGSVGSGGRAALGVRERSCPAEPSPLGPPAAEPVAVARGRYLGEVRRAKRRRRPAGPSEAQPLTA